jgi:hypothetical protein
VSLQRSASQRIASSPGQPSRTAPSKRIDSQIPEPSPGALPAAISVAATVDKKLSPALNRLSVQNEVADDPSQGPDPDIGSRPPSANSHHSQGPSWHARNEYDDDKLQHLFRRLLKLDPANEENLADIQFYTQCIYNQLYYREFDSSPLRVSVIEHVGIAMREVDVPMSAQELRAVIRKIDADKNARIDEGEFRELIAVLFVLIRNQKMLQLRSVENDSAEHGGRVAVLEVLDIFRKEPALTVLPYWWKTPETADQLDDTQWRPSHILSSINFSEANRPIATHSFAMLAFMAEYFCMPVLVKAMSGWRSYLNDIGDAKSLYLEPLKMVRDAVTQFAYFEDEKGSSDLNAIDCFIAQADVLAYEPHLKEPDGPLRYLIDVRSECYRVMRLILGFLFDLRTEKQKKFVQALPAAGSIQELFDADHDFLSNACSPRRPPLLAEWRKLRMAERAQSIDADVARWSKMKEKLRTFDGWYQSKWDPGEKGACAKEALKRSESARLAQVELLDRTAVEEAEKRGNKILLSRLCVLIKPKAPARTTRRPRKKTEDYDHKGLYLRVQVKHAEQYHFYGYEEDGLAKLTELETAPSQTSGAAQWTETTNLYGHSQIFPLSTC